MADTFGDWQKEASRDVKKVDVCFDRALVSELEEAVARLAKGKPEGMLEGAPDLESEVERLRAEVEAKTRTLVFENIGRRPWRKLLAEHPPTPEQKRENPELDHNPETFPSVAMAAACVQPGLTVEQADWMAEHLPLAKYEGVWMTCLAANIRGADEKKALASAAPRPTGKRSRPLSSSESLEASSSAE